MPQLLTVSRAARLVGASRGALQKKILNNELSTFEGMIKASDLLRAYPQAHLEDDSALERVRHIRTHASPSDREQTSLPPPEVLAKRLTHLSYELVETRAALQHYAQLAEQLEHQLDSAQQASPHPSLKALQEWLHEELCKHPKVSQRKTELLVRDTFLRLLSATIKVIPSGKEFLLEGQHSLLEAALNAGLHLNYGCTSGHCGACKARVISGETLKIREHSYELSPTEQNLGYVLMCSYTAATDATLEAAEAQHVEDIPLQNIRTSVKQCIRSSDDLLILQLQTPKTQSLRFMAGQGARLSFSIEGTESNPVRKMSSTSALSMASCPCDGHHLQFHLRNTDSDEFLSTLFKQVSVGDTIELQGPEGDFVLHQEAGTHLIFVAQGDGFAALKSLIEQTVSVERAESIRLYWIANTPAGHYMNNLCRAWTDALDQFTYRPLLTDQEDSDADKVATALATDLADLQHHQMYVAGESVFVSGLHEVLTQTQQLPESQFFSLIQTSCAQTPLSTPS